MLGPGERKKNPSTELGVWFYEMICFKFTGFSLDSKLTVSPTQGLRWARILAILRQLVVCNKKSCYVGELTPPDAPPQIHTVALPPNHGSPGSSLPCPRAQSQVTAATFGSLTPSDRAFFRFHTPCFLILGSSVVTVPTLSTLPCVGRATDVPTHRFSCCPKTQPPDVQREGPGAWSKSAPYPSLHPST